MSQIDDVGYPEGVCSALPDRASVTSELAEIAATSGLRRVQLNGWRDLHDPEAGGSEVYASTIPGLWAEAGIDVTMLTPAVPGHPWQVGRNGYRVIRRFGRFSVFSRMAASGALGHLGRPDRLIEIWNGMPFFSPLWAHCPRVVFLHHVHAEMWDIVPAQPALARLGKFIEFRAAPPLYKGSRIVTLSPSSRREIAERLGLPITNIAVVPPGGDRRFSPGDQKDGDPLVVAVGRLVPVKRFDLLIDALAELRRRHPTLRAVIVGEGYERPMLEARVKAGVDTRIKVDTRIMPRLSRGRCQSWPVAKGRPDALTCRYASHRVAEGRGSSTDNAEVGGSIPPSPHRKTAWSGPLLTAVTAAKRPSSTRGALHPCRPTGGAGGVQGPGGSRP
jgi:hypothetical protein